MKHRRLHFFLPLLFAFSALSAVAQPPVEGAPKLIDYQGTVLDLNGNPLAPSIPTNYTMKFRLYSAQSGGAAIWSESQTVTVSNGAFSVRLGQGIAIGTDPRPDLSTAFTGKDRFLGLTVVIPPQAEAEITPRLAFLTSPFSFIAERAKTADSVLQSNGTSTLGTTTITNLTLAGPGRFNGNNTLEFGSGVVGKSADAGKIGYGTFTLNTLDIVGAGSASNGSDRKVKIFAEGGLTVAGPLSLSGNQTIAPPSTLSFGNTTRQMVNLWDTSFGFGIQNNTLYSRSSDNYAWFRGGLHNDNQNNPGTGGTLLASLNINGLNVNTGQLNLTTASHVASILSSSSTIGTWLDLQNTSSGGNHWQLISTGSANGGGAGNLQIGTGPSAGVSSGVLFLNQNGTVSSSGTLVSGGGLNVNGGNLNISGGNRQFNLNTGGAGNVTAFIESRPSDGHILYLAVPNGGPVFAFQTNGVAAKPGGGSWAASSDSRLKKNVEELEGALPKLLKLRSVTFDYNNPKYGSGRQTGFIAQEIEKVFPEWVSEDSDKYKMIGFSGFESLTVQALRELRSEKDQQLAARDLEIAALRKEFAAMAAGEVEREKRLATIERIISSQASISGSATTSQSPLPGRMLDDAAVGQQLMPVIQAE